MVELFPALIYAGSSMIHQTSIDIRDSLLHDWVAVWSVKYSEIESIANAVQ